MIKGLWKNHSHEPMVRRVTKHGQAWHSFPQLCSASRSVTYLCPHRSNALDLVCICSLHFGMIRQFERPFPPLEYMGLLPCKQERALVLPSKARPVGGVPFFPAKSPYCCSWNWDRSEASCSWLEAGKGEPLFSLISKWSPSLRLGIRHLWGVPVCFIKVLFHYWYLKAVSFCCFLVVFWLLGGTIGGRALLRIQNLWPATLERTLAEASWLQHGKTDLGLPEAQHPPHVLNQHRVLMYAASICSWPCQTQGLLKKVKLKMALRSWKCTSGLLHKQCESAGLHSSVARNPVPRR